MSLADFLSPGQYYFRQPRTIARHQVEAVFYASREMPQFIRMHQPRQNSGATPEKHLDIFYHLLNLRVILYIYNPDTIL